MFLLIIKVAFGPIKLIDLSRASSYTEIGNLSKAKS